MRTQSIRIAIAVLLVLLPTASFTSVAGQSRDLELLVRENTAFALDLYSILKKEKGNLFLSPYSISSALAMTYGGARGDTEEEMAKTLHFALGREKTHPGFAELEATLGEIQKEGSVQLYIANSLWPQKDYPFMPAFLALMKQDYGVSVTPVDYVTAADEACKIINAWVEERTKEKIKDLIRGGDLNPLTVLVLVNAIYFKGNWASEFDPTHTQDSEFALLGGRKTRVSMMYQKGSFGYGEIEGAQVLELPYVGKQLSMVIVLPADSSGLSKLEDQLSVENLDSWFSRITEQDVDVYLPRFKITWGTFELNKPLQALGMRKAFGSEADFSGMDGTRNLFVALVLHKAFVEVNEEGTEAAAATAVMMERGIPRIQTFRADHPFLFLIRDNVTGSILFLGRLVDPSTAKE